MRTYPYFLLLLCIAFANCTRNINLTVLQPAQLTLPEHISKVAVVDRSKPSNGWLNVLEGLFTGEAIGQDRRSREEAVNGLNDALTRTPRFTVARTGIEMSGSKTGNNLPVPLSWAEIDKICADYGANAVVTIESFDSDNSSSARRVETKRKDKNGKEYKDISYDALQRTGVRIGWRMYDPKRKIIFDEYTTDDYLERRGSGNTERDALSNLPSPVNVTRDVAYNVGLEYGSRIAPLYVTVSRPYYHKANGHKSEMKQAARYLQARDFVKARAIWDRVAASGDRKAAGRALHNLAVAAELEGNTQMAEELARKAWTEYGNKKARTYVTVLKMRQNDDRKAASQIPGKKV
jgi:hypothetical protein